jgi:hypothetical protein
MTALVHQSKHPTKVKEQNGKSLEWTNSRPGIAISPNTVSTGVSMNCARQAEMQRYVLIGLVVDWVQAGMSNSRGKTLYRFYDSITILERRNNV